MKNYKVSICFLFSIIILFCATPGLNAQNRQQKLKIGNWRGEIIRQDGKKIIFQFETKDSLNRQVIYIINGKERLLVDSITFSGDSVFIELPFFESRFRMRMMPHGNLVGTWIKDYGNRIQRMPVKADYNYKERFEVKEKPSFDISGRWVTEFLSGNKADTIVAEFHQKGSHVSGTFLDPTGDYRFLDGVVDGDSLKLSTFDGAHAYLFTAKIENRNKISGGKFYSGATFVQDWQGQKNDNAVVSSGFQAVKLSPESEKLSFTFPNSSDGKPVSITDKKFQDKVVIVQILGSWCPNCMDETKFLSDNYNKYHKKGFEVIGLAYERTTDFSKSQQALLPFKKRFHVQYPILITGVTVSDSLRAQKTLPQLKSIDAFPTTLFIDKKGNIRYIESGFSGPATGVHYLEFQKKFTKIMTELLGE